MSRTDDAVARALKVADLRVDTDRGLVWRVRDSRNGRALTPLDKVTTSGYATLYVGAGVSAKRARVVWIAANGIPAEGMAVCHRNNVKDDDRLENLYLATPGQNVADAHRDHLMNGSRGPRDRHFLYLTDRFVEFRELAGVAQTEFARRAQTNQSTISRIEHRKVGMRAARARRILGAVGLTLEDAIERQLVTFGKDKGEAR